MFLPTTPSKFFLSLFLVAFLGEWTSAQLVPPNYRRQTPAPNGQTHTANTPVNYFECGFDRMRAQSVQTNPLLEQIQRDLDEQLSRKIKSGIAMSRPRAVLTVPIVFHIIHNNGASNISNARILTAVQQLNDAFANRATYQTAGGVDMEIQFCLAQRDPSGNTTNGINRVVSPLTVMDMNADDIAVKNLSRWTPTQYVNIWVVDEIVGGVAGYAYLPSAHGLNMDGIVLEDDWVGNSRANSAVLTHEMGHYFGIFHTFEGGCTNTDCTLNGDRVCDTPPDNTTSRPPCNAPANSCTSDADDLSANNPFRPIANGGLGDQPDPISNYMDYSNFSCYDRFSAGQKVRALFFLNGTRQSLLNSLGCLPPCTSPISLSFSPSALTVTQGGTLSFNNTTSNATTYNWYANGVQFSTIQNPTFTFNTLGAVWIRLRANNADPNCYREDSVQINVLCGAIAGFSASNLNPNIGTSVNFTFTGSGANTYEWYDNGTLFANVANTSRTFNAASSHAIKLVVQSATGCRDSITQIVRAVCPVVLGYNISNNYPRAGQTVTFTSSTTNATNLSWSVNGVPVSSATTYNYVAPATNFFRVCLTADNGACTVTECQSVFMNTDTNNCNNTYLKTLGNNTVGWDVEPTANGFLYISGSVADSSLLVYVNGNGNAIWQRKFKFTTGTDERITKTLVDSDGNLVCIGTCRTGIIQNFIFKYNPNTHSILWATRTSTETYAQNIMEPSAGANYRLVGQSTNLVSAGCDAMHLEINRNTGAVVSAYHYDLGSCDDIHKLVPYNGFLYGAGRYTIGASTTNMRPAITKMDASGQSLWTKLYLYSQNITARLYSYDMVLDRDSFVVASFGDATGGNLTNSTLFLFKIDTAGNPVWTRQYDLTNGASDYATRVLNLPDGYLILGYYDRAGSGQEAFLLKTDKNGNQLWAKSYGTPQTDNFQDFVYTNQSVYAVGLTNGLGTAQNHILFARLDTAGNTQATCVNITAVATNQSSVPPFQSPVRPSVFTTLPVYTNVLVAPDSLNLPATFQCATPCPENCTNGIDDDGDGLVDCSDTTDCACNLCESGGGNNWFFGSRGAITFNTPSGEPTALPIAPIQTSEGSASISDVNGNLLFFTDGTTVWNRNNVVMPNGTGLFGDAISAQSGVIVPSPANDGKYYLYTVRNWTTGGNGIHYSVVDMNLQGGLGDVVSTQKNVFVNAAARESLSSTSHCNGRDAWVVFQEPTTNRYFAYLITSAGISPTPIISTVGSPFNGNNRYGYLRFSHDGRKLCMALGGFGSSPTTVELYDFDNSTGQLTNPQTLATTTDIPNAYGVEFSPDDSRLYVTSFNGTHIFQYNLELNGTANIVASKTDIASAFAGIIKPSLQMAPNGKIYVSQNGQSVLGVIQNPNELGANTNFSSNGVSIPGASCGLGLPNFNQSIFRITNLPNIVGEDTLCQPYTNQTYRIKKRDACLTDTVIWRVRGTSTIVSRTDTSVIISPNGNGFDTLTVEIRERCATVFDTFVIAKFNTPILNLPNDTTLCNNAPVPLNAGAGFVSYRWQNGVTTNTYTADTEGWHRVTATNVCNQAQIDSIFVNYDTLQIVAVPDTQVCFGDTFRIALNPAFNYQWTPNLAISCLTCSNPSFYPNVNTSYIGVITNPNNGCTAVDTFELTYRSCSLVDTVRIDTNICPYNTFTYRGRTVLPNTRDTLLVNATPRDTLYLVHTTASPLPTLADYQSGVSVVTPNCFGANTGRITFSWSQGAQPYTYLWANGQFLPTATGLVDGVYSLTLRDAYGCTVSFSSTISSPAFLSSTLSSSVANCNTATGASITSTYTGGNAPHTFLWSNGATTQNLTGIGTGGYRYTVTDANGCIAINYISVQIPSIPALNAFIGQLGTQDTSILFGDTVNINANANVSNLVYSWRELNQPSQAQIQNPNISATSARPILSGNYVFVVSATVNGLPCASTDTVRLTVQPQTIFSLPTAFAPDGNGDNDRFRPIGLNSAYIKEFRIFNRWGQMLYDNATLSDGGWDGFYKGTLQNRDVYICVITYQRPQDAEPMTIRTEFTLLK